MILESLTAASEGRHPYRFSFQILLLVALLTAFLTAFYTFRAYFLTFHGEPRTPPEAEHHAHESPWIMLLPLVVLAVLSTFGGVLNLPTSRWLDHWLEPVVGESILRITHGAAVEASATIEYSLIGAAVLIAIGGIVLAWAMLKPERLVPKRDAKQEEGFERVLVNKYYVDEIYDTGVVQPTVGISRNLLSEGIDQGLIDGVMVKFFGTKIPSFVGWVGSQLQSGQVGTYAWVLVVGVLFVLGAFTIR